MQVRQADVVNNPSPLSRAHPLATTPAKNFSSESVIGRRCDFANANYLKRIFLAGTGMTRTFLIVGL